MSNEVERITRSSRKIIIIGGVAGGATAAARLRRLSEADDIILFEKGEHISFANCGLPYHIGGLIKDRESLLLNSVEDLKGKYKLDVRNFSEVLSIDREKKQVTVMNHKTGEKYEESYDKLIISTGADPIIPKIKGVHEANNVFSLRNIQDMDSIIDFIQSGNVKTATVVGGGFIGLEVMENLTELGIRVQLVEMSKQVMNNIDYDMAQILHAQIEMHGVRLILGDGIKEFRKNGEELITQSGQVLKTDMTILAIGVKPNSKLAEDAGLELGIKGTIKVDDQLKTSDDDIYAIGDAIEVSDKVSHKPTNIPLAWPANRQGRIVADILNGMSTKYSGSLGSSVAKVFELTVSSTGNGEKLLIQEGIEFEAIHIHPSSHAGYYPGASPISIKLLMGKDGKILGAQAIGSEGVKKRIDIISTAMEFGGKAIDLSRIQISYAPPYSSAKDPVNILGYVAENILEGKVKTFQWYEIEKLNKKDAYLLDVRETVELSTGQINDSINIPLSELRERIGEIPKEKDIYVYCQVGHRGYNAARILEQSGYNVFNLDGGYKTYKYANYKLNVENSYVTPESNSFVAKGERKTDTKFFDGKKDVNETKGMTKLRSDVADVVRLDACGLQCPGPILKVKEKMDEISSGQVLEVEASDFGFGADIEAWCKNTGNILLDNRIEKNKVVARIAKGEVDKSERANIFYGCPTQLQKENVLSSDKEGATMVVFSGDLDKAIASMIIASGAAAYGKKVTLFFTFWGLSILKKRRVKKRGLAKLFDIMLPKKAEKLPLSKMNMLGMGPEMIKGIMRKKNVNSLPELIEDAHKLGVKFVACTMSMDLMGIEKEELFDFVEYGGVATFIGDSEESNMQLFI